MYELIKVAENTFYMDCPTKVGIYKTSLDEVVLIDSGSDKDAAKKLMKILNEQCWKLKAIYNTHSHADHIGGNQYLQDQTGCKVYARGVERCFASYPVLEPTMLFGGFAPEELHNKFLMAKESNVDELSDDVLPEGLSIIELPGHCSEMVGFRTSDDIVFLADALASKDTLKKYQVSYIYDIKQFILTLEKVKSLKAKLFIPSHADACENIVDLAQFNILHTKEIEQRILDILSVPKTFDDLMTELFNSFNHTINFQQYFLVGSTIKSYLSFMKDSGLINYCVNENRLLWCQSEGINEFSRIPGLVTEDWTNS